MATANWSVVSKENTNFARVCKLVIDGATRVLRDVFDNFHKPQPLHTFLKDPKNHATLKKLKTTKKLTDPQWNKLYPTGSTKVDSSGFDITLLCALLRSLCNLPPPIGGWNNPPAPTSTNTEDDLVRIRLWRNELIGHTPKTALSDTEFHRYWTDIKNVLVRLGGAKYQPDIDKLEVVSVDPEDQKYYIDCLEEWAKNDERIMKALEATEERLAQKMDETQFEVTEKMDSTKKELAAKIDHQAEKMDDHQAETQRKLDEIVSILQAQSRASVPDTSVQDSELFSQKLKSAVQNKLQSQEEFLISPLLEKMRLEDIFTQLIMYYGPREKSKFSQSVPIHNIEDVFVDKEKKENPKSVLIKGNAGVGKSLFSKKLFHDWATNCILSQNESADNPVIKFAFLLTFRQLNMLAEKELSVSELLKGFSMLDENVDDSVIEYIIQHPEQLFILIDGYDEYMDEERHKMDNQYFESSFPDNPNSKMPVAALVSKLIKKKILSNSVVMVTSRPGEAEEIKYLKFDRYIYILGYSEEQVIEYVTRYFKRNKEMQTIALSTVQNNQDYLRFGRIPLMCLLMCVYIENNITNSSKCFPKTITAFYTEVIQCIEKYYNKAIQKANLDEKTTSSVLEKMKDKMSELAARSLVRGKYSFNEEDFKQLNISELGLTYLKCSSLLFCESSVRKSALSSEVTHEYCFNHTTFHEYFAARYFVKMNQIPTNAKVSRITLQFLAGLMDPEKDKQLMIKLLQYIYKIVEGSLVVALTCLYEFGDETLAKQLVQENKHNRYWGSDGWIRLCKIDYKVVVWYVYILTLLNQEQSLSSYSPVSYLQLLDISNSHLTLLGVEALFTSLTNKLCTVTTLGLSHCGIDDKCCECLSRYMPQTQITSLSLYDNNITDHGVLFIVKCCNLKLKYLNLWNNKTNEKHVRELFKDKYPDLVLLV